MVDAPYRIVIYPDQRLSQISKVVACVDKSIQDIMDKMLITARVFDGLGVAAVQVGIMKRIVVIDMNNSYKERYNYQPSEKGEPLYMVNPNIIEFSEEQTVLNEGCLSIPSIRADVTRPSCVKVEYLDYKGDKQTLSADGLLAKCIQHEIDHLNGKVILDYLSPLKKQIQIKKMYKYLKLSPIN